VKRCSKWRGNARARQGERELAGVTPIPDYYRLEACLSRVLRFHVFNLGSPKTGGDWIVHIVAAIVAIFLVWWMLRLYVL
jgi:hypothetical protein